MSNRGTLSLLPLLLLLGPAHAEEQTFTYKVKRGDTCPKIAEDIYGPGTKWSVVHEFNPEVGPLLPCKIRKGMTLVMPVRETDAAAELTSTQQTVETRTPSSADWKTGAPGQGLYRGWRVSTREESAAEITFRDDSVIEMRENALVIIFGASSRQARRRTSRARLERGSLRSRLTELDGSANLNVETPSGLASFSGGASVVSVDDSGTALVCNHEGNEAVVVSTAAPKRPVKVAKGMGSKVKKGRRPSKPKPLPVAPTWKDGPTEFATLANTGTLTGAWNPAPKAEQYRIEIARGANGEKVVAAARVHESAEHTFRLEGLEPGVYYVRLSTIDKEGFEGIATPTRKMELLALEVAPPGSEAYAATQVEKGVAPAVLQGTAVKAPKGMLCSASAGDDASPSRGSNPMVLVTPGEQSVVCKKGGTELYRADVRVVPLGIAIADGEKAEITAERGVAQRFDAKFSAPGVEIPESVRIVADPGLQIEASTLTEDGRAAFTVTADAEAKNPSFVYITAGDGPKPFRLMQIAVNIREVAPPPPVAATNTPDLRPPGGQEALNGMLLPSLVGVDDEQRNGFGAWLSTAPLALVERDETGATERSIRMVPGFEANLADDRLRLTLAAPFSIDTSGAVVKGPNSRGVFGAVGWRIKPRTLENPWGLAIEIGVSAPVFDSDGEYRLRPALDFSYAFSSSVVGRTRQAALVDATEDAGAFWASAYALEWRAASAFSVGLEGAVTVGRELDDRDVTYVTAGLPLGLHTETMSFTLTPHVPVTVDAQRLLGKVFGVLDVRARF